MTIINNEDWLKVLENTDYEPIEDDSNVYLSYRFSELDIESVTITNYEKKINAFFSGANKHVYTSFR